MLDDQKQKAHESMHVIENHGVHAVDRAARAPTCRVVEGARGHGVVFEWLLGAVVHPRVHSVLPRQHVACSAAVAMVGTGLGLGAPRESLRARPFWAASDY